MPKFSQANRPLNLHLADLGDDAVVLLVFEGEEAISTLFSFRLEFLAPVSQPIAFDKVLGQPATVELNFPTDTARYFNGIVSEITEIERDKQYIHYRAELVPAFWYWQHRVRSRIFQWTSVPDILTTVLDGLRVTGLLSASYPTRAYCVQYQESDFAFASRLMEEEGIAYYFKHASDNHALTLSDARGNYIPAPTAVRFSHHARHGATRVTRWSRTQRVVCPRQTVLDYSFLLAEKQLIDNKQKVPDTIQVGEVTCPVAAKGTDANETCHYPASAKGFDNVGVSGEDKDLPSLWAEMTRVAKLRVQAEAARAFAISGSSTATQFVPGFKFTLEHHGSDNGDYLFTRLVHHARGVSPASGQEEPKHTRPARVLSRAIPVEDDEEEFTYTNDFDCIPNAVQYRPIRRTPRPVILGVQTATVVTHGSDSSLDKFGRVKVKFHWDRSSVTDLNASCWLRVAQVWAGKKWGGMFFPRAGNEVVVAFVDGDPDCPLVVGSVYNSVNMPPYDLPDNATVGGIKSCIFGSDADKHFNGIFFHDGKGEEFTHVHSETSDVQHAEENRFSHVPHRECSFSGGFPV